MVELLRPYVQIIDLSNDALTQLLLYRDQDLSYELNRNILKLTLRFIHETGCFVHNWSLQDLSQSDQFRE